MYDEKEHVRTGQPTATFVRLLALELFRFGNKPKALDDVARFSLDSTTHQGRKPRISGQEPLPQISPSVRGSTDLPGILDRGGTLGPGLDIGFREEPENITATEVVDDPISDGGSGGGNGRFSDDRPPPSEAAQSTTVGSTKSYNEVRNERDLFLVQAPSWVMGKEEIQAKGSREGSVSPVGTCLEARAS